MLMSTSFLHPKVLKCPKCGYAFADQTAFQAHKTYAVGIVPSFLAFNDTQPHDRTKRHYRLKGNKGGLTTSGLVRACANPATLAELEEIGAVWCLVTNSLETT